MRANEWKGSREAYVAFRKTKRELNAAGKRVNTTYAKLKKAFNGMMNATASAFNNTDDDTDRKIERWGAAYKAFQEAKESHDAARDTYNAAFRNFRKEEIRYTVTLFKGLMETHKFRVADLARLFGIYDTRITAWLKNANDEERLEQYKDEYGNADVDEEGDT